MKVLSKNIKIYFKCLNPGNESCSFTDLVETYITHIVEAGVPSCPRCGYQMELAKEALITN